MHTHSHTLTKHTHTHTHTHSHSHNTYGMLGDADRVFGLTAWFAREKRPSTRKPPQTRHTQNSRIIWPNVYKGAYSRRQHAPGQGACCKLYSAIVRRSGGVLSGAAPPPGAPGSTHAALSSHSFFSHAIFPLSSLFLLAV